MDDCGSIEEAVCRGADDLWRSTAVFHARVAKSTHMLTQLAKSKQSLNDLKGPWTFLGQPNWPRSA